jgi:hypothetical protein
MVVTMAMRMTVIVPMVMRCHAASYQQGPAPPRKSLDVMAGTDLEAANAERQHASFGQPVAKIRTPPGI